ncbi:MAG: hypothetical protein ACREH8_04880 [Opitutaceae bacterium]
MKTLTKFVIAAVLSGAAVSCAGPPPQFWQNRPAAKPRPLKAQTAPSIAQSDALRLTCAYMVVPNTGQGFHKSPVATVRCTPEMMKKSPQCQAACAANAARR